MLIRPATADDILAMTRLADSSPTAAHWTPEQYRRVFALDAPRRAIWVIQGDAEEGVGDSNERNLQAFLVAQEVAGEWEVENIVVDKRMQRQRLATRLLTELKDVARVERASAIFLEVRESNHEARAFYRSRGFSPTGRRARYYSDPDEDAITYRLQLA